VEADPKQVEARRNLAQALVQEGNLERAIRVLKDGIEVDGSNPWLQHDLGTTYLALGRRERAIRAFQKSIELAPEIQTAHFNLANALAQGEQWQEAIAPLEALLELDPSESRGRYLLAMARHKTGQSPVAIQRFQSLIADDPDSLLLRQGLATVYMESRRLPQAMATLEGALALDLSLEEKAALEARLAELAWQRGQKQRAVDFYRQAVRDQPKSSTLTANLANVLQLTGRREEAMQLFARATELDPDNLAAWVSESALHILLAQFGPARLRLEAGLAQHPSDGKLMHTLARLLATCPDSSIRDGEQALRLSRRAFGIDNNVDHAETVAMAMAELGRFDKAAEWQRALAMRALRTGDRPLAQRLTQRLAFYERREPIRMGAGG
jgi:tetratricopeptide (TPR) repeat protein